MNDSEEKESKVIFTFEVIAFIVLIIAFILLGFFVL